VRIGGGYPNLPDPELEAPGRAYHDANLDRLRRMKATYDRENVPVRSVGPARLASVVARRPFTAPEKQTSELAGGDDVVPSSLSVDCRASKAAK
jgi:hypothetical protein